jgi:predicted nucleic acid-binding protein
MIAVDSSVWIDQLRGNVSSQTQRLGKHVRAGGVIAVTDIVYMEILRGARTEPEVAAVKLGIQRAEMLRLSEIADFEQAADLYRRARSAGKTVRNISDCMIAAVCIREGVPILHDDADFDRIADVSELKVA